MEMFIQLVPNLAFAAFLFYVLRWLVSHFDPHVSRLLDRVDDIRETGQRMADIGERLVKIIEAQQEWQESRDTLLTERHRRIMERLDIIDSHYVKILYRMSECTRGLESEK